MKDLPRVFANPLEKDINNNRSFSYDHLQEENKTLSRGEINEKIESLFGKEGNAYSKDCLVKFATHSEKYTIIGRTKSSLVTKSSKLIAIDDIKDIEAI